MPSLTIKLRTVSPLFLNGADKNQPELRAASVRGQLRYWFRAIWGSRVSDLNKIWERESAIFGNNEVGSRVAVRILNRKPPALADAALLPHRTHGQGSQKAIRSETNFLLQICTPPGIEIPQEAFLSLQMWLLLGGIGKRSRRMFGALAAEDFWDPRLTSPDALISNIQKAINRFAREPAKLAQTYPDHKPPSFPTLNPNHSRICVGQLPLESAVDANRKLFGILRSDQFRQHERIFGHAMGGRRASPLIAQVRRIGDGYYPVLTIMRSSDLGTKEWAILNTFIDTCERSFDGQTVWGVS